MEDFIQLVLLLMPLVIVELVMRIYTIFDILKEERKVLGNYKIIWILVCGIMTFGWAIYLVIGREDLR